MSEHHRRVFLVNEKKFPQGARIEPALHTRAWISADPPVWFRTMRSEVDGSRAYTNQQEYAEKPTPLENERRIQPYEAEEMFEKASASVTKNRYRIKVKDHVWSVDEYLGPLAGLWMAVIDLEAPEETFIKPDWIDRDVTNDAKYDELTLGTTRKLPEA